MRRLAINRAKQRSLTVYYWKLGQRVLRATQQPVIDLAANMDPEELKRRASSLMKGDHVQGYISDIWVKGGSTFAIDMVKRIAKIPRKQETNPDFWEDYFRAYTRERTAAITGEILDSQAVAVNEVIDDLIQEAMERGIGVPEVRRALQSDLIDALTEINGYQAERIARTEMIGASNTGSFEGALESGIEMKKIWSTSGLPGIRDSHMYYESLGAVEMDYEYAPGLQYPGDPAGAPEEIINCRCTQLYEVDEVD